MTEPQDAIAAGLDRLNEGFGNFDADLRLVASNRLFAELRASRRSPKPRNRGSWWRC